MMLRVYVRRMYIEDYAKRNNLTMGWIAGELGLSKSHFSAIISQVKCPSAEVRERMQKFFKLRGNDWDKLFQMVEVQVDDTVAAKKKNSYNR